MLSFPIILKLMSTARLDLTAAAAAALVNWTNYAKSEKYHIHLRLHCTAQENLKILPV